MAEIEPLKPLVPQRLKFTQLDEIDSDTEQTQENRMPFTITNINNDVRCLPNKNIEGEKMSRKVCDSTDKENDHRPFENVVIGEVIVESRPNCECPATPHYSEGVDPSQPLTPTANLKMLFSAVSPELRNRENQRLELFKAEQSDESFQELHIKIDVNVKISSSPESETGKPGSRKEKSLGLLCQKFLQKYPEYPSTDNKTQICLDEVAKELGVERRRIYDIVNVLESVEVVSRMAKNKYAWHGKTNLVSTLTKLKALGEAEGFLDQMNKLKDFELNRELDEQNETDSNSEKPYIQPTAECLELGVTGVIRKNKSLGIMSQKFLMLFLVSKPRTVNLDQSAKMLIGDPNVDRTENAKFKTKIRRLYDIANILTSLDLIQKVHVTEFRGRKPAFKYIGPEIDNVKGMDISCSDVCHRPSSRHSMLDCVKNQNEQKEKLDENYLGSDKSVCKAFARHASFEQICQVAETEHKKLYASASLPTSPVKEVENQGEKSVVEEAVSIQTASQIQHLILQHSGGKCHVVDDTEESTSPHTGVHHLPVQSIACENTNKAMPKIVSPGNTQSPMTTEMILIKTNPDVIPLTDDQIHAVLKSLKMPVPFNKIKNNKITVDTSVLSNPVKQATGSEPSTTCMTVDSTTDINCNKRPCPDTEQSTPMEKRIKMMFPTPPTDNEDTSCYEQIKESPQKQLHLTSGNVTMNSLLVNTHTSELLSSTQSHICGATSHAQSLVQMPFSTMPSNKIFFVNSPLVSTAGQPMQVIQEVPNTSDQPVNFVVPITYTPPLTPVSTTSPTSNMSFSPAHLLEPLTGPVSGFSHSYYGNTPSNLLPFLSNSIQRTSRLAIPIVSKQGVMSTARRLNLPLI